MLNFKKPAIILFSSLLTFNAQANFALTQVYEVAGNSPPDNFPAIDRNAEPIETLGIISKTGVDYFVVDGHTIWFDSSASIKF